MSFKGKDTLSDGREILLFQQRDEMIVKLVESPEESEQASQWQYGKLLDLEAPDAKTHEKVERKPEDRGYHR